MLITEQVEEINILRDNNQSMVIQISENVRMEQKINWRNKDQNQEEELFQLVEEIKHLKDINEEKEINLENVSN